MHLNQTRKPILKRMLFSILCIVFYFTACNTAALAYNNSATDEVGAATTIYQHYKENNIADTLSIDTNVAGKSPEIEQFIDRALNLSTRLLPFSYDAVIQFYADTDPTTFFVSFRNREYNDLNDAVQQKVDALAAQAATLPTDYDKLVFINDYLVDHCAYLSDAITHPDLHPNAFTAYGCLIEGKAVCEGYTNAVQLLCEAMEIPSIKVTGSVENGNHIWNAVYLDHKWWMLDTTFNDPIGMQEEADRSRFFLIDMDTFQQIGMHVYDTEAFELSKQIYLGKTIGQFTPIAENALSLQNATAEDKPNGTNNSDAQDILAYADALRERGLFVGDENGYRLNDAMTRIEMGVMVTRMYGGIAFTAEKTEAYYQTICPFIDVPNWAKSSIGYLYDQRLVAGQSETTFGTNAVSKRDYAVMMLRLLNIDHTYENALGIALQKGIVSEAQVKGEPIATRGDVVAMTYHTILLLDAQTSAAETDNLQTDETLQETNNPANNIAQNNEYTSESPESILTGENNQENIDGTKEDETASEEVDEKEEAIRN